MKVNNIIILAGTLLAGVSYMAGKKAGEKEAIYQFQTELRKIMVEYKEEKESD